MFSTTSIPFTIFCLSSCTEDLDLRRSAKYGSGADLVTGIALIAIGALVLGGSIPSTTLVGGLLVSLGSLQLIGMTIMTHINFRCTPQTEEL